MKQREEVRKQVCGVVETWVQSLRACPSHKPPAGHWRPVRALGAQVRSVLGLSEAESRTLRDALSAKRFVMADARFAVSDFGYGVQHG